jgi:hypothetical protein
MVQFSGDLLHPPGIGRAIHDADAGRVSPEGVAGEGIDNVQFRMHEGKLYAGADKGSGTTVFYGEKTLFIRAFRFPENLYGVSRRYWDHEIPRIRLARLVCYHYPGIAVRDPVPGPLFFGHDVS